MRRRAPAPREDPAYRDDRRAGDEHHHERLSRPWVRHGIAFRRGRPTARRRCYFGRAPSRAPAPQLCEMTTRASRFCASSDAQSGLAQFGQGRHGPDVPQSDPARSRAPVVVLTKRRDPACRARATRWPESASRRPQASACLTAADTDLPPADRHRLTRAALSTIAYARYRDRGSSAAATNAEADASNEIVGKQVGAARQIGASSNGPGALHAAEPGHNAPASGHLRAYQAGGWRRRSHASAAAAAWQKWQPVPC